MYSQKLSLQLEKLKAEFRGPVTEKTEYLHKAWWLLGGAIGAGIYESWMANNFKDDFASISKAARELYILYGFDQVQMRSNFEHFEYECVREAFPKYINMAMYRGLFTDGKAYELKTLSGDLKNADQVKKELEIAYN